MGLEFAPMPEDEFVIYGTITAKPGLGDKVEWHLRNLARLVESEPGVSLYKVSRDTANPEVFHAFEQYAGREAFESHVSSKEFLDFANADLLVLPAIPTVLKTLKPL